MNKDCTVLAIDTSTATMAGSVIRGSQQLSSVQTEAERNHSIHIMTNIEAMLKESGLQVNQLDMLVTGIGPGSYTGVRIAVTAAKTLAWIADVPLIGISSLAGLAFSGVLAEGDRLTDALVLPIMDARRGQVYTAAFQYNRNNDEAKRLKQDHIVMMQDWCDYWTEQLIELKAQGVLSIVFVGDVALHQERIASIKEAAERAGLGVTAEAYAMNGHALAELGCGRWLNEAAAPDEPHELVPNYAQLTEAEVKQNAKDREEGKG